MIPVCRLVCPLSPERTLALRLTQTEVEVWAGHLLGGRRTGTTYSDSYKEHQSHDWGLGEVT